MTLVTRKRKRAKAGQRIKWGKLKEEECCEDSRERLRQALCGHEELPGDWVTTATVIRETGREVSGVSSGQRTENTETWWWKEEVRESIQRKRLIYGRITMSCVRRWIMRKESGRKLRHSTE